MRTLVEEFSSGKEGIFWADKIVLFPCVMSSQPDAFGNNNLALPEDEMQGDMGPLELWLERQMKAIHTNSVGMFSIHISSLI